MEVPKIQIKGQIAEISTITMIRKRLIVHDLQDRMNLRERRKDFQDGKKVILCYTTRSKA